MVTDKKIPLLTEVYQPRTPADAGFRTTRQDDATLITPELIARIASHIKPRLEADIARTVTESVRVALEQDLVKVIQDEILTLQSAIEARTVDFVDKTKADLKTDLPRMYQASADTAFNNLSENIAGLQSNAISTFDATLTELMQTAVGTANTQIESQVEAIQADASARIMQDINQQLSAFQVQSLGNHQALLNSEMQQASQSINQQGKSELQEQLRAMQTEALAQMRATFTEAMPTIYTSSVGEQQEIITAQIGERLNQELQAFQAKALANHQALLDQEMQQAFQSTNQQAKVELQQQLQSLQTEALAQMRATFIEAMPSIYTASVASQQELIAAQIGERLNQEMQAFQVQSVSDHQVQLGDALAANLQALNQSTKQDLQQQMSVLQADVLLQINTTFKEAIPSIYAAAVDEVKAKFADEMTTQSMQLRDNFLTTINADLPAVQEVLRDNIQQIMAVSLPNLELDLRNQLTAELQDLLLKVKFVLPK